MEFISGKEKVHTFRIQISEMVTRPKNVGDFIYYAQYVGENARYFVILVI